MSWILALLGFAAGTPKRQDRHPGHTKRREPATSGVRPLHRPRRVKACRGEGVLRPQRPGLAKDRPWRHLLGRLLGEPEPKCAVRAQHRAQRRAA